MADAAGNFPAALVGGKLRACGAQARIHEFAHLTVHVHGLFQALGWRHAAINLHLAGVGVERMGGGGEHGGTVDRVTLRRKPGFGGNGNLPGRFSH